MKRLAPHASAAIAAGLSALLLAGASPALASVFSNEHRWPAPPARAGGGGSGLVNIPVCIVGGSSVARTVADPHLIAHAPNPTLDDVITNVRAALRTTWEAHSAVRFTDWRGCDALTQVQRDEAVGLYLTTDGGNAAHNGTNAKGRTTAENSGITFQAWGPSWADTQCIRWSFGTLRYEYHLSCVREFAIHEFGHVLGFLHEWQHPAKPDSCEPGEGEDPVPATDASPTFDPRFKYTIVNPDAFDWDSVMTYGTDCADVTGERFGSPTPSETDLRGVRAVYPPANDVGVLAGDGAAGCGSAERIEIVLDDENNGGTSALSGWTGASRLGRHGPELVFCRADGSRFAPAGRPYAVLKLAGDCPAGSSPAGRVFDSDDDTMASSVSDEDAAWPNGVTIHGKRNGGATDATRDIILLFCVFPGIGGAGPPQLPYSYGVLAPADFPGALAAGTIHVDDENDNNSNEVSSDVNGFSSLIEAGEDTTLHLVSIVGARPAISAIANQTTDEDTTLGPIAFTVADPDTAADRLAVSASHAGAVVQRVQLSGTGPNRQLTVVPQANAAGAGTITVTVSDGAQSASESFSVTVVPVNDPPVVRIELFASYFEENFGHRLHAIASDADGDPITYAWDATAGRVGPSGTPVIYVHEDGPASVTIGVTASDPSGATGRDSITREVRNGRPFGLPGEDASAYWGLPVAFDGRAFDPSPVDAAALTTRWHFGDGHETEQLQTSHTYAVPGSYSATLEVTDKDGASSTAARMVTIRRRATEVVYTGAGTAPFGFATLSARLADEVDPPSALLSGRTVKFTAAGQALPAPASAGGIVTATAPPLAPGTHEIDVSFAGDQLYEPSTTTGTLRVVNSRGRVNGEVETAGDGEAELMVRSDERGLSGELELEFGGDETETTQLEGLGISGDGRKAWLAAHDHAGRRLVAYVEDNSINGRFDVFTLTRDGVILADGRIQDGNVHVRR